MAPPDAGPASGGPRHDRRPVPVPVGGAGRRDLGGDGQTPRAGGRRGEAGSLDLPLVRRTRARTARAREAGRPGRAGEHGDHRAGGAAGRGHALELPLLSGRPVRRPQPHGRQHGHPQTRLDLREELRAHRAGPTRGRTARGRVHQRLRLLGPGGADDRRPAGARRLPDRQRTRGCGCRRGGGQEPHQERARARRLGPAHRPGHRRSGRARRHPRPGAVVQLRAGVQLAQAHVRPRGPLRRVRRRTHRSLRTYQGGPGRRREHGDGAAVQ